MSDFHETILGLTQEALEAFHAKDSTGLYGKLNEVKGWIAAEISRKDCWQFIKERYEAGEAPRKIALAVAAQDISTKQIRSRASREKWLSGRKIKIAKKKAVAILIDKKGYQRDCTMCGHTFFTLAVNANHCNRCQNEVLEESGAVKKAMMRVR